MREIKDINNFIKNVPIFNIDMNANTNTNIIDTATHLTEEILLETISEIEGFNKKKEMKKLLREFLEVIEKKDIKEILLYNSGMIDKGKMILHY